MQAHLEQRLRELKAEYEADQQMLVELEAKEEQAANSNQIFLPLVER